MAGSARESRRPNRSGTRAIGPFAFPAGTCREEHPMWSAISRSLPQFAPARRHHSRRQFTLERLEERSLLSTVSLTVNTTSDDPSPGGPTPGVSGRLRGVSGGVSGVGRLRGQTNLEVTSGAIGGMCMRSTRLRGCWGRTEFPVNWKLGLTSRQETRERRIVTTVKPFRWNPAGNQSRPVEPDQQPEASLAWWVGDHPCEA